MGCQENYCDFRSLSDQIGFERLSDLIAIILTFDNTALLAGLADIVLYSFDPRGSTYLLLVYFSYFPGLFFLNKTVLALLTFLAVL